jgi:hypothetical protein
MENVRERKTLSLALLSLQGNTMAPLVKFAKALGEDAFLKQTNPSVSVIYCVSDATSITCHFM